MNARNARILIGNARVHSFARRVNVQAEAAKLDVAIAPNLKEIGYGG